MKGLSGSFFAGARRTLRLARRFGQGRLSWVIALSSLQAVVQMLAVASVMPFLSLAASDPATGPAWERAATLFPGLDPSRTLLYAGGTVIALQILSGILGLAGDYSRSYFAHFTVERMAGEMARRIAARPYLEQVRSNSSRLLKALRDDVHLFLTEVLLPLMDAAVRSVTALLLLAVLFLLDPAVALVAGTVFGGLYLAVLIALRGVLARANWRRNDLVQRQYHTASELLQHFKVILVTGTRDRFVDRYRDASRALAANEAPVSVLRVAPRFIMEMLAFSTLILVVLWSLRNPEEAPDIVPLAGTYAVCGYRLLPSLSLIYAQIVSVMTKHAVATEIETILASPLPSVPQNPPPQLHLRHSVELRQISFSYGQEAHHALDQIDLEIPAGAHIGIVGATGSGKSSLIDVLLGLLPPSHGDLLLDGARIGDPATPVAAWQNLLGYVPQDVALLDDTLLENILFGQARNDEELRRVTRLAQIDRFIETELHQGYATPVGERGAQLSGGQRQRIALARALYRRPELLILDEATSALDQETERAVLDGLRAASTGLTILTVAHRPAAVRFTDRIYVLDRGRVAASGTFASLLESSPAFQTLFREVAS